MLHARQALEARTLEQIAGDALDAPGGELLAQAALREARDADHALGGAARQARERRPHLAGDAEHQDLVDAGEVAVELGARARHEFLELLDVGKTRRQVTHGVDYYRPPWRAF